MCEIKGKDFLCLHGCIFSPKRGGEGWLWWNEAQIEMQIYEESEKGSWSEPHVQYMCF